MFRVVESVAGYYKIIFVGVAYQLTHKSLIFEFTYSKPTPDKSNNRNTYCLWIIWNQNMCFDDRFEKKNIWNFWASNLYIIMI